MLNVGSLKEFLEKQMPATLEMLRQMVGINSFTANREGVNRLGRFTAECFAPLGFAAEFVPSTNPEFGNHLVLTRRGRSAKSIAMVSHLDTVFSPEEEARIPRKLPYMVFVIDELADLIITTKEVEGSIIRIAQKARAVSGPTLALMYERMGFTRP